MLDVDTEDLDSALSLDPFIRFQSMHAEDTTHLPGSGSGSGRSSRGRDGFHHRSAIDRRDLDWKPVRSV